MTQTKKNSDKASAKEELWVLRETMKEMSLGQKLLFPVAVLLGVGSELIDIFRIDRAGKQLTSTLMEKYKLDAVKLNALGCTTDPKNIYQSQMSVMQVDGKDYAFVLDFDQETKAPVLHRAPYISDSMPYKPYPVDPVELLK